MFSKLSARNSILLLLTVCILVIALFSKSTFVPVTQNHQMQTSNVQVESYVNASEGHGVDKADKASPNLFQLLLFVCANVIAAVSICALVLMLICQKPWRQHSKKIEPHLS